MNVVSGNLRLRLALLAFKREGERCLADSDTTADTYCSSRDPDAYARAHGSALGNPDTYPVALHDAVSCGLTDAEPDADVAAGKPDLPHDDRVRSAPDLYAVHSTSCCVGERRTGRPDHDPADELKEKP